MKRWIRNLYLRLSDCDGMCNLCEPTLKGLCEDRKAEFKTKENGRKEIYRSVQ